jgi:glycine/D-amino acid oxidase-like deaminating enzyme
VGALGGGRRVVHGYGAGGRGYELSWGIAERLVDLIEGEKPLRAML